MTELHAQLREYVNFLIEKYERDYQHYLYLLNADMHTAAEFWNGFKESTLATINDLEELLERSVL